MIAFVKLVNRFSCGVQGYARVEKEENGLRTLRMIEGDVDDMDLRVYRLEEEIVPCSWAECFINDNYIEVKGQKPVGYEYLCSLTKQIV